MLRWLSGDSDAVKTNQGETDGSTAASAVPSLAVDVPLVEDGEEQQEGLEMPGGFASMKRDVDMNGADTLSASNHTENDRDAFKGPSIVAPSHATPLDKQTVDKAASSMPEFKAPSISLSSSPSTSTSAPPALSVSSSSTTSKPATRPKPSHRPFPPEQPALQANGRLTVGSSSSSTLGLPPSTTVKPRKQRFVALEPGYSPLDWAKLNSEGDDDELRCGFDRPQRLTMREVAEHATPNDAWSVFNGRVYNITPYLHFHPGGVKELMRVAGKDGTELFMQTHAWVNAELMMEGCLIGFVVRE